MLTTAVPVRSRCAVYDAPYTPAPMDAAETLRNAFRCALDDLESAEHAFDMARKRLGHANRAPIAGRGFDAPRAVRKANAMRTLNRARAALRRAQAASLAALDALAIIPGAAARIIESRSF